MTYTNIPHLQNLVLASIPVAILIMGANFNLSLFKNLTEPVKDFSIFETKSRNLSWNIRQQ